jgi:hypothetical protein
MFGRESQQDAAAWVVDATAKVAATPTPDAHTSHELDIAKHAAKVHGTTLDQIADAADKRRR